MVKSAEFKVSQYERDLIQAIRDLRFGELYGVEIPHDTADLTMEISQQMRSLITYLREYPYISVLTIHAGQPVMAETDLKIAGFHARKKVRFDTG